MANKHSPQKSRTADTRMQSSMIGDGLSFAAAEAYKLLRTNLMFALPDKPCRMIGVTSSVRGEGKSTTAVNLAYTLAESGKRVLLIDADMRLPSIASKLSIDGTPGLSNMLAGLSEEEDCVRATRYFNNWYLLPAGDIPPNPSELLSSERMRALLKRYEDIFDYVVIDLPPATVVTDALAISTLIDGLIVVVRQNYAERRELDACMYQIGKIGSKFLGFVMTDAAVSESSYKRYGKYGKYGKYGYDYGYGYGYENTATSKKNTAAFINATKDRSPKPEAAAPEKAAETTKETAKDD